MVHFYQRLILILLLTSTLLCLHTKLIAQPDFFLDSVAVVSIEIPTSASLTTSKYFYNSDCKLAKLLTGSSEYTYFYEDNIIAEEIRSVNNPDNFLRLESIFNDSDQIVLFLKIRQQNLISIDSFFYKNNLLEAKKYYRATPVGNHILLKKESFHYNFTGLLESQQTILYDQTSQDSIAFVHEEFTYDENMNILSEIKTESTELTGISYDSIFYSYNAEQNIQKKTRVFGNNTSSFHVQSDYSYKDSLNSILLSLNLSDTLRKLNRTEINYTQNNYFEYDTMIIYEFVSENDSVTSHLETNSLFFSVSGDTILHRNSKTDLEDFNVAKQEITKNFYLRHPEFFRLVRGNLAKMSVFPNPVSAGGVLKVAEAKFEFDKVMIYPLNNGKLQIIEAGRSRRYFNAPRESGTYLVQLWNKDLPVTEFAKVIVH